MTPNQIIDTAKKDFDKAYIHFQEESKKLRTGRAHPSMVEGLLVTAYGVPTPLLQLATITTPEASQIAISPFDPTNVQKIAEAITTERRQQIVKQLSEKKEDCFVSQRQARHDAMDALKKLKTDKAIGEDDLSRSEKAIDDAMAKSKSDVESFAKSKETEIMTV
jgi:ribosome recycling factor